MSNLAIGESFPDARLQDIDAETVEFPAVFAKAPPAIPSFASTEVAGDPGVGPR